MKILMISKALVAAAYHSKLRELAKSGVKLSVVVPNRWGRQRLESVRPDGYELLVSDCRFNTGIQARLAHHFHFYPGIDQIVRSEDWDLVHIDEEPFNFVTYHTAISCSRHGHKVLFFSWQNIEKRYLPPFYFFEKRVYETACGAIAGSAEVSKVMRIRGFSKPLCVVPQFGIDPDCFKRSDATVLRRGLGFGGAFIIGYMGRIVREKGVDTLVRALSSLPADCTLVLVGSGPDKPRLEKLISHLELGQRIRWIPHVNSEDVADYLNAMDVLVLPSRTRANWKEQFGRVLIEAMACETCVVGSDSGEIPNVIGTAGLVFPEGNHQELARKIQLLIHDSTLRQQLARRGRERALERFTHANIARETIRFYRSVCSGCECESA